MLFNIYFIELLYENHSKSFFVFKIIGFFIIFKKLNMSALKILIKFSIEIIENCKFFSTTLKELKKITKSDDIDH